MRTPARIFLLLSLPLGVLFAIATPPFQAPDEPVHFYRAFSIAQGAFFPEREAGRLGDELPLSVIESANRLTGDIAGHPERTVSRGVLVRELARPLLPLERRFEPIGAAYSPVSYVPQSLAIAFTASAGGGPIDCLIAARIAALIATSFLVYAAILLAPFSRWTLAFLGLLPMSLHLRASASADAMTLALAFLLVAAALRLLFPAENDSRGAWTAFLASAVLLPMTKIVYAPMALLVAVRARSRPLLLASAVVLAAGGVLAAVLWSGVVATRPIPERAVDPQAQIARALQEPLATAAMIAAHYARYIPRYAMHAMGRLGWLDTPLPVPLIAAYALALAFLLLAWDGPAVDWRARAVAAAIAGVVMAAIAFGMYVAWTPVGLRHIEGIQGRYFLPLAPLAVLIFSGRRFAPLLERSWFPRAFASLNAVGLLATVWVILERYY